MSTTKMKNIEIIKNYESLIRLQETEKKFFEKTGEKLLQGRVKISFAINRNLEIFRKAIKPYNDTIVEIIEEYRDGDAEKEALENEEKKAEKEKRKKKEISVIMRPGKTKEEYLKKVEELQNIEVELNISTVSCDLLDGIKLDSFELEPLTFMIEE